MDRQTIGMKLRALRGNATIETVSNSIGISASALTMYELGQRIPRDEIKIKLASYYNVRVDDLFFDNELHET